MLLLVLLLLPVCTSLPAMNISSKCCQEPNWTNMSHTRLEPVVLDGKYVFFQSICTLQHSVPVQKCVSFLSATFGMYQYTDCVRKTWYVIIFNIEVFTRFPNCIEHKYLSVFWSSLTLVCKVPSKIHQLSAAAHFSKVFVKFCIFKQQLLQHLVFTACVGVTNTWDSDTTKDFTSIVHSASCSKL